MQGGFPRANAVRFHDFADTAPIFGWWNAHVGWGTVPAILIGTAAVAWGASTAKRLSWRRLTWVVWATSFSWAFALAMILLVGLAIVMFVMRWWGEATYVLLTCVALGTSTLFYSVPRSAVVLFPVWMLLGVWMTRSRAVAWTYVAVAAPLMIVGVIGFTQGHWIA